MIYGKDTWRLVVDVVPLKGRIKSLNWIWFPKFSHTSVHLGGIRGVSKWGCSVKRHETNGRQIWQFADAPNPTNLTNLPICVGGGGGGGFVCWLREAGNVPSHPPNLHPENNPQQGKDHPKVYISKCVISKCLTSPIYNPQHNTIIYHKYISSIYHKYISHTKKCVLKHCHRSIFHSPICTHQKNHFTGNARISPTCNIFFSSNLPFVGFYGYATIPPIYIRGQPATRETHVYFTYL